MMLKVKGQERVSRQVEVEISMEDAFENVVSRLLEEGNLNPGAYLKDGMIVHHVEHYHGDGDEEIDNRYPESHDVEFLQAITHIRDRIRKKRPVIGKIKSL